MNQSLTLKRRNISLIGFEELFKMLDMPTTKQKQKQKQDYPPHNLVKTSDNSYILTLAIIGRDREDINIELKNNTLTISAEVLETDKSLEIIEHGIAFRAFKKDFKLQENVIVTQAKLENGLLHIYLEHEVPENNPTTNIKIT